MMLPAFRNLDASLEEAAWVSGVSKTYTVSRIVLPLLGPSMVAVCIFYFVLGVEMFDFVAIIGMPGDVLVLWIYDAIAETDGPPNLGFAGAAGVVLFVICGVAILFYARFLKQARKYAVVGGKVRASAPQPLGRWRWAAYAWVGVWVMVSIGIPVVTIVWVALVPYFQPPSIAALDSVNLDSFRDALAWIGEPLRHTLILMAGSIVVAASLATSVTWVVTRSRNGTARWADNIVFLAPAVPTIVTGVAFQFIGIEMYHWIPLFGTIWLVAIAMGTRMLAYCTRTMNAASLQIHFELDEAAYVSGVSMLETFRRIFLPLMAPAIFLLRPDGRNARGARPDAAAGDEHRQLRGGRHPLLQSPDQRRAERRRGGGLLHDIRSLHPGAGRTAHDRDAGDPRPRRCPPQRSAEPAVRLGGRACKTCPQAKARVR